MSDYEVFKKVTRRHLEQIDQDIDKLHDLLEELDMDSDRVDDARTELGKMQFAYADVKRAIDAITEEDCIEEEEEEEDEEEENE